MLEVPHARESLSMPGALRRVGRSGRTPGAGASVRGGAQHRIDPIRLNSAMARLAQVCLPPAVMVWPSRPGSDCLEGRFTLGINLRFPGWWLP